MISCASRHLLMATVLSATLVGAPIPAAAYPLTSPHIPAACNAQLETYLRSTEKELEQTAALRRSERDPDPEMQRLMTEEADRVAKQLASFRANGANDPEFAEAWAYRAKVLPSASVAELQQGLAELREVDSPANRLDISVLETALAAKTGGSAAPVPTPLRPTVMQEAHNPAGEASDCLEAIFHPDFVARGIKSNMEAVIRNKCARPVSVTWCVKGCDCKPGYANLGTVPAGGYHPVSFVYKGPTRIEFAGCYNGFTRDQGELGRKLLHACK